MIEIINTILAIGAVATLLGSLALIALMIFKKNSPILSWVYEKGLSIGLIISLSAVIGSLVYSNGVGYEPCILCWYQRIAIFPLPVIFLSGLIKKNRDFALPACILSGVGLIVALYHNYIDWGGSEFVSCGVGPSCLQRFVAEFGFVTIPFMSLSILLFSFALSILLLRKQKVSL